MNKKAFSISLCAALTIGLLSGCASTNSASGHNANSEIKNTTIAAAVTEAQHDTLSLGDPLLDKNFNLVCSLVGIDTNDILKFEKADDWAGGPRYTFIYQKAPFVVFCNTDSTINALQIGDETDIFKKGLEPYTVSDFIATEDEKLQLQIKGEDTIKGYLNHPDEADFHTMDWRFGRDHDLYNVSGSVTAENSFGVKDKLQFSVNYYAHDNSMTPIYVSLGDSILMNNMDNYTRPEREAVEDVQESNIQDTASNGIILEDGQLGEYGKEDKVGNEVYIDYYIPAGNYSVKNLANPCKVFVIDTTSNEPVLTVDLAKDSVDLLEVKENQHVELTLYGKVILTPIG